MVTALRKIQIRREATRGTPVVSAMDILFGLTTVLCGGVLALAWVTIRGGLVDLLRRASETIYVSLATRRWTYAAPAPGSPAAGGIPFAVAMALGVAAQQQWGSPWT